MGWVVVAGEVPACAAGGAAERRFGEGLVGAQVFGRGGAARVARAGGAKQDESPAGSSDRPVLRDMDTFRGLMARSLPAPHLAQEGYSQVSPKPAIAILIERVEAGQPLIRRRLVIPAMASGEGLK